MKEQAQATGGATTTNGEKVPAINLNKSLPNNDKNAPQSSVSVKDPVTGSETQYYTETEKTPHQTNRTASRMKLA